MCYFLTFLFEWEFLEEEQITTKRHKQTGGMCIHMPRGRPHLLPETHVTITNIAHVTLCIPHHAKDALNKHDHACYTAHDSFSRANTPPHEHLHLTNLDWDQALRRTGTIRTCGLEARAKDRQGYFVYVMCFISVKTPTQVDPTFTYLKGHRIRQSCDTYH